MCRLKVLLRKQLTIRVGLTVHLTASVKKLGDLIQVECSLFYDT